MKFNTNNEGVRIPLWLATVIAAIISPIGLGIAADVDVKYIIAQVLLSLAALVPATESARANVFSRNTVDDIIDETYEFAVDDA